MPQDLVSQVLLILPSARYPMSTLEALVSLISSSVAEYSEQLSNVSLPLPDLNSTSPPVTRTGLPEDARLKAARAVKIIEAACAQLVATVADPGNVILTKATAVRMV